MFKDLMIVIDNFDQEKSRGFLQAALALAERCKAHATVTLLTPGPLAAAEFAPIGAFYVTEEALARDEADRISRVRELVKDAKCSVDVRGFHDDVAWLPGDVRRSRQLADLIVAGSIYSWDVPWLRRRVLDTLLLASGTPILLLPEEGTLEKIEHAVFGWKPSPEANRALHDLVAIAEPGALIDVVMVDGASHPHSGGIEAGAEVVRHLTSHGFNVEVHALQLEAWQTVAGVLQTFAIGRRANLLAIGGYAHSRMREVWLGGATHDVIAETELPVLLSH